MYYCDQCQKPCPGNDSTFTEGGGVVCEDCRKKGWTEGDQRTLADLALEVLDAHSAKRLPGVVESWSAAVHRLEALYPRACQRWINRHPINVMWQRIVYCLINGHSRRSPRVQKAFDRVRKLARKVET